MSAGRHNYEYCPSGTEYEEALANHNHFGYLHFSFLDILGLSDWNSFFFLLTHRRESECGSLEALCAHCRRVTVSFQVRLLI